MLVKQKSIFSFPKNNDTYGGNWFTLSYLVKHFSLHSKLINRTSTHYCQPPNYHLLVMFPVFDRQPLSPLSITSHYHFWWPIFITTSFLRSLPLQVAVDLYHHQLLASATIFVFGDLRHHWFSIVFSRMQLNTWKYFSKYFSEYIQMLENIFRWTKYSNTYHIILYNIIY